MQQKFSSDSEEPPDSLLKRGKILTLEPKKEIGSFLISENIEIVSDISHCFQLWQEFSPQKTLFDTWEFRLAFYLGYGYKLYFLLLKNKNENLALLPLWYDLDRKKYFWFGSDWQEEVSFFSKDPSFIPILLSIAPSPLYINSINEESVEPLKSEVKFKKDESKYILNLNGFRNHEDYLMTLKKNTRRNLRKDRNRILRQNPEIIINNFSDFKYLVKLSKERFNQKGEKTDWEDKRRIETFLRVIQLAGKSYQARMITIKVGNEIAGVDLVCLHNNTYFALKCGYDVKNFPGIGNFMNLFEIDDAIRLGMKKIDFLQNSYQWKDRYFQAVPLFYYQK